MWLLYPFFVLHIPGCFSNLSCIMIVLSLRQLIIYDLQYWNVIFFTIHIYLRAFHLGIMTLLSMDFLPSRTMAMLAKNHTMNCSHQLRRIGVMLINQWTSRGRIPVFINWWCSCCCRMRSYISNKFAAFTFFLQNSAINIFHLFPGFWLA